MPPALKTLAALVISRHKRREIAYMLALPDTALRQRISALKRHVRAKGLVAPEELTGLNLDLAYGRIRDALLPTLIRRGGCLPAMIRTASFCGKALTTAVTMAMG